MSILKGALKKSPPASAPTASPNFGPTFDTPDGPEEAESGHGESSAPSAPPPPPPVLPPTHEVEPLLPLDARTSEDPAPLPVGSGKAELTTPGTTSALSMTLEESAAKINDFLHTPAVQAAALEYLKQSGSIPSGPRYDAAGNSVIVSLDGPSLDTLRDAWVAHNQTANRKIDFSDYVSLRIRRCSPHSSEKSLYFDQTQVSRVERIADENFGSGESVVNWIERYRLLHVAAGEEMLTLDPIEPKILVRLQDRLYDRYPTLTEMLNDLLKKAMYEEVGLDYFLRS